MEREAEQFRKALEELAKGDHTDPDVRTARAVLEELLRLERKKAA